MFEVVPGRRQGEMSVARAIMCDVENVSVSVTLREEDEW